MTIPNIDNLIICYMDKLQKHWKHILHNPCYNKYNHLLSMTHLSGIHLEFYHKPHLFIKKKYPELAFRNIILKKIVRLNNLLEGKIYLSPLVITEMINQCNLIINNTEYWMRYGFSQIQATHINETYLVFIKFLQDYVKYLPNININPNTNQCIGLGKTDEGEELYQFMLRYHTGF